METFTRVSGRMIKPMDMESTCILMAPSTKGTGKKINSMELVRKHGQTVHVTKEIT